MRCPVNKSLDKSPVNFGIRGSYIRYVGLGAGIALILGLIVGIFTGFFIGFIVFAGGSAFVYFRVSNYQERVSEKERDQILSAFYVPRRIRVRPVRCYRLLRAEFNKVKDLQDIPNKRIVKQK